MSELSYEELLERALKVAVEGLDLEIAAETVGEEPLTNEDGAPVEVSEVVTLAEGGFMTTDNGVAIRLSDGREYTIEIKRYR